MEYIYKKTHTEVKIKSKQGFTESFWTGNGVRQVCVLNPLLFNLYIAELDLEMEKRGFFFGGVIIDGKRIWNLAYADDIVLRPKNRVALLHMMDTLYKKIFEKEKITVMCRKVKDFSFQ